MDQQIITVVKPDSVSSGTGHFKAVCHKCHYVGFEPNTNSCVHCGFPIILERYESAQVALREIFDRSSVELGVNIKAPPLPGVDPQKRKAQLLAEARRRLRAESQARRQETARPVTESPAPVVHVEPVRALQHAMPQPAHAGMPYHHQGAAPVQRLQAQAAPVQHLSHHAAPASQRPEINRLGMHDVSISHKPRRARLGMALAFLSAILVGVAAAAMNSGF